MYSKQIDLRISIFIYISKEEEIFLGAPIKQYDEMLKV